jgi:hypothetical protein
VYERALGQARFAQSGLSRGGHFANAALRIAGEERADVLSHPGRANFARDAIRVFRCRELQDQDQMRVIDLRNTRGERPRVDDKLHTLPRRPHGRIGHRFAQAEVVDDNVHRSKLSRTARTCSGVIPERWPSPVLRVLAG